MTINMDLVNLRLSQIRQMDEQLEERSNLLDAFVNGLLVQPQRDELVRKMIREIVEMSK